MELMRQALVGLDLSQSSIRKESSNLIFHHSFSGVAKLAVLTGGFMTYPSLWVDSGFLPGVGAINREEEFLCISCLVGLGFASGWLWFRSYSVSKFCVSWGIFCFSNASVSRFRSYSVSNCGCSWGPFCISIASYSYFWFLAFKYFRMQNTATRTMRSKRISIKTSVIVRTATLPVSELISF